MQLLKETSGRIVSVVPEHTGKKGVFSLEVVLK